MTNTPELRNDRVILRKMSQADADALYVLVLGRLHRTTCDRHLAQVEVAGIQLALCLCSQAADY